MSTGGSFVIEDGKRVLKEQTKQQATLTHAQKVAAANPKTRAKKSKSGVK